MQYDFRFEQIVGLTKEEIKLANSLRLSPYCYVENKLSSCSSAKDVIDEILRFSTTYGVSLDDINFSTEIEHGYYNTQYPVVELQTTQLKTVSQVREELNKFNKSKEQQEERGKRAIRISSFEKEI